MPLDVGKLRATIELDLDQFRSDLDRAGAEFKQLGTKAEDAVARAEKAFTQTGRDADKMAQGTRQALGKVESESRSAFGRVESDATSAFKGAESEAKRAGDGITGAFRKAGTDGKQALSQSFSGMGSEAISSGKDTASGFVDGFGGPIAKIGGKGGAIGVALAGAAALGIGAGKLLADNILEGLNEQQQRGQTKATFGWSERQLAEAGKAAAGAYTDVFGESVNENMRAAGIAMQSGLLDGNATAAQIQPVIEQLQTVSGLMEVDVTEAARAAGQMVKTGLADNATEALDLITVAQQEGLNLSGDLLDTLNEYGTQFRKVGLDGADALGLISQAWQNGARDTDVAADAIKEFTLRATDGSEATATALQGLGLNVEDVTSKLAQGGEGAKQGLDSILDKLREMPPSVEKNQIAAALFGTQWEDLGAAFDHFDLSTARGEMGQFAGATDRAADAAANGATSIEGLKRRIEVAMDGMQAKLANAFGPGIGEFGAWVETHGTEIENFFISAAKYGAEFGGVMLQSGGYLLGFGANVMKVGSWIAEGLITPVGQVLKTLGSLASHLPGALGENGRAMQAAGEEAMTFGGKMRTTADAMSKSAEMMGLAGSKARELADQIHQIPEGKAITVTDPGGQGVVDRLREMGIGVTTNNDKTISTVMPAGDEVLGKLQAIGLEVETRNGKQIIVRADDSEYTLKSATWTRTEDKYIRLIPTSEYSSIPIGTTPQSGGAFAGDTYHGPGRAAGGQVFGPGGPRGDGFLVPLSDREFVHQTAAVDHYGVGFMNAVNDMRFPKVLAQGFADGGLFDRGAAESFAKAHDDEPYVYGGLDCSGYLSGIHSAGTGQQSRFTTDSNFTSMGWAPGDDPNAAWVIGTDGGSGMNGHMAGRLFGVPVESGGNGVQYDSPAQDPRNFPNVYHWPGAGGIQATASAAAPPVATVPLTQNPDGTWTSSDPAWAHLIERESGGDPDIVQQIQDVNSGGNEASGLFQIAKGTWAGYGGTEFAPTAGEATPEQQAEVAARIFNKEGGSPWGSGLEGRETDEGLRAGITMRSTAPAPAPTGTTAGAVGGVQQVFVTNWPSGMTSSVPVSTNTNEPTANATTVETKPAEKQEPAASITSKYAPGMALNMYAAGIDADELEKRYPSMRRYGVGGTIPGVGNTDSVPLWGMPGEEIIRKSVASQPGMRDYLKAINHGLVKAPKYGNGGTVGFGGYSDTEVDAMAPNNWYDYLALAGGTGFAALSVAEPYIDSAITGNWDLGNITPQLNTGNNTSTLLGNVVGEVGGQIQQQLAKIIELTAQGKVIVIKGEREQSSFATSPGMTVGQVGYSGAGR